MEPKRKWLHALSWLFIAGVLFLLLTGCGTQNGSDDGTANADSLSADSETTIEITETSLELSDGAASEPVREDSEPESPTITKEFVRDYLNNYFVIEGASDEKEALLGICQYKNRGDLDISVTVLSVYDFLDKQDPAYYDFDAQNLKTQVVTLFIPARSSVLYYENIGCKNNMGNDATLAPFSGGLISAEIAGVTYEYSRS